MNAPAVPPHAHARGWDPDRIDRRLPGWSVPVRAQVVQVLGTCPPRDASVEEPPRDSLSENTWRLLRRDFAGKTAAPNGLSM